MYGPFYGFYFLYIRSCFFFLNCKGKETERYLSLYPIWQALFRIHISTPIFLFVQIRRLELNLAEALEKGCDTVIGCGPITSNNCRTLAVCGKELGFAIHLCLHNAPLVSRNAPVWNRLSNCNPSAMEFVRSIIIPGQRLEVTGLASIPYNINMAGVSLLKA